MLNLMTQIFSKKNDVFEIKNDVYLIANFYPEI